MEDFWKRSTTVVYEIQGENKNADILMNVIAAIMD